MELLLAVILLVVLAVLALQFGYDSREVIQSKEAELACFGMQWQVRGGAQVARPPSRQRRLRRRAARGLLKLADWLSPAGTPLTRTS